jgi:hypothetical protein
MKNLSLSVFVGLITLGALAGCSSAQKEEPSSAAPQAAVEDKTPVNLGASTSGRSK